MRIPAFIRLIPLLLAVVITLGCGKNDETDAATKAATQVAAKVNSEEITVHQINYVLVRNPKIQPEAAFDAKREILERLIDQQLAKQEAIANKLDRSPGVVQALEAARNEILARAHLEKITAAQPRPTDDEVKKYYVEHPELFARRRVFSLEEIHVAPQEGLAVALREQVAKARSLQDIAAWLKSQDARFTVNKGTRAAEQIPLQLLPKLQAMKDGAIQLFEPGDGRIYVIRIAASKPAPVDEATAAQRIQQFLFNQRSSEAIAAEIKRLKDKAQIAYVGEFAEGTAAAAKAKEDAAAKAKALAEVTEKEKAGAQARSEALAKARRDAETKDRLDSEARAKERASKPISIPKEAMEKGLHGLK